VPAANWLFSSDRYRVPGRFFRDVPEDFYGLVGRVAMLSALLEDRLHVLYCALAGAHQDKLAGESGTRLVKECRERLDRLRDEHRAEAAAFLDRAQAALNRRHEVVHSLWPFTEGPDARGWRDTRSQLAKWTELTASDLPMLVTDFVGLVDDVRRAETWAQMGYRAT
jgi:hypothetical protein